jgi:siroheme synthase-like protein
MKLLPVALNVENKRCLVVGGGGVATRKVRALLECGAKVAVVAPQVTEDLKASLPPVEYSERGYQSDDCDNCELVFACTDDAVLNARIARDAASRNVWCNVADDSDASTFHLAAAVRRGEICIGISTGGGSPALAKHLRKQVVEWVGVVYALLLEMMSTRRERLKHEITSQAGRAEFWRAVLESEVLTFLRQGKREAAEALVEQLLIARS